MKTIIISNNIDSVNDLNFQETAECVIFRKSRDNT